MVENNPPEIPSVYVIKNRQRLLDIEYSDTTAIDEMRDKVDAVKLISQEISIMCSNTVQGMNFI